MVEVQTSLSVNMEVKFGSCNTQHIEHRDQVRGYTMGRVSKIPKS